MPSDQGQAVDYGAINFTPGSVPLAQAPKKLLRRFLSRLRVGRIVVQTPAGMLVEYSASEAGPEGVIVLHNWRPLRLLLSKGGLGFAESYMDGDWSTPDLTAFLEMAGRNIESLDTVIARSPWLRAFSRLRHRGRANTRQGSRRNIAFHYDLGNEFYSRWLDAGMSYSSAFYATPEQSLEDAQEAKLDRVIDRLSLKGGERVLEIGCGWGALAEKLIRRGAGSVTGLTLSAEQLRFARNRLDCAGLAGRADLRLQDYRDVEGRFDRIVSVEMLEAVGQEYWPAYFDALGKHLTADGRAVLQVITIAGSRYARYQRGVDFIQRYIFPGGMLPSDAVVRQEIARAGFELQEFETFGVSYALTLAEWRRRFHESWAAIQSFGFDERFRRMWEYYLSYCEAGFRTGMLDVGLYSIARPTRLAAQ